MSRPVIEYRSSSKEAYKDFKKAHPKVKLTYAQFKSIIKTSNSIIISEIMENGTKVRLPHGFGDLTIHKWKPKKYVTINDKTYINLPIDWTKTMQTGKRVYHMNYHTDGYRFKWKWFVRTAYLEQRLCFQFKPNRLISRKLASYLKKPNSTYAQLYRTWTS